MVAAGSDKTGGITDALVAFQAALPHVGKSSTAQYGKYADLADVAGVVLPRLAQHGMCYTAPLERTEDGLFILHAQLRHTSGEIINAEWPITVAGPQQMGSAITYGRRYCLLALTGVHPEGEDDDGAAAEQPKKATRSRGKPAGDDPWEIREGPPPPGARPKGTDPRSPEQSKAMFTLLAELGLKDDPDRGRRLLARLAGLETLASTKDLTRAEASAAIDALMAIARLADPRAAVAAALGEDRPGNVSAPPAGEPGEPAAVTAPAGGSA